MPNDTKPTISEKYGFRNLRHPERIWAKTPLPKRVGRDDFSVGMTRVSIGHSVLHLFAVVACLLCKTALPAVFATDAETGLALPHTWMVATRTVCEGIAHCSSSCVEVRAGVDENVLPLWRPDTDYVWQFYRAGYYEVNIKPSQPKLSRKRPAGFAPEWDDASARIAYLNALALHASCPQASASDRQQLVPFYRDLITEGFSLATLPEQKEAVQAVCRELLNVAGSDTAPLACFEKLDWRERDALLEAARQGDVTALDTMLPVATTPAFRTRRLAPALAIAASTGQVAAMRWLLDHHADTGPAFERLLQQVGGGAVPSGEFETRTGVVRHRVISANRVDPEAAEAPQMTPVERARVAAELLLAAGADTRHMDNQGHTPLHRMAIAGDAPMIALLLRYGASVNQPAADCPSCISSGETPLADAANASIAKQLIAAGANVNAKDRNGRPALILTNKADVALALIDHGADVNVTYFNDWTPLMNWLHIYELYRKHPMAQTYADVARRLVAAGASLTAKNSEGIAAIDYTTDAQFKAELQKIASQQNTSAH